jgi:hypothetical protein
MCSSIAAEARAHNPCSFSKSCLLNVFPFSTAANEVFAQVEPEFSGGRPGHDLEMCSFRATTEGGHPRYMTVRTPHQDTKNLKGVNAVAHPDSSIQRVSVPATACWSATDMSPTALHSLRTQLRSNLHVLPVDTRIASNLALYLCTEL